MNNISLHDWPMQELKILGHKLLDEYILLDRNKGRVSRRSKVEAAYEKLSNKLGRTDGTHHFGNMQTKTEVIEAIVKLRKMIKKRANKNERLGTDKATYAPNLRELQKRLK